MRRFFRDERGSVPFTCAFVLAMMILLQCFMLWTSSQINVMSIRNHIKEELAAVSIRISDDTYTAMSEGDLSEYHRMLSSDAAYREELKQLVIDGIRSSMDLETQNYSIRDIGLDFTEEGGSIGYVFSCYVDYRLALLGDTRVISTDEIVLSGQHNIKNY